MTIISDKGWMHAAAQSNWSAWRSHISSVREDQFRGIIKFIVVGHLGSSKWELVGQES